MNEWINEWMNEGCLTNGSDLQEIPQQKLHFLQFSVRIQPQAPQTVLMFSTDAYFPIRCDK